MTIEQTKASIQSQLNQQIIATLTDNLATISVANEELKAKVAELEAKIVSADNRIVELTTMNAAK